MKKIAFFFTASIFLFSCSSNSTDSTSDAAEEVKTEITGSISFANINDGDTLTSPFSIEMGVEGMTVEPAGEPKEGFGHHHLVINDDFIAKGLVVIADSTHIHYGGGQTSDSIALIPGNYKLTLQFADGMHTSYGENWSKTVQVVVE